jgi:hypothetical protein
MMVAEVRQLDRRSVADIRGVERTARRSEEREAWGKVIYLTGRGHLSVVAERPDLSVQTFGEIRSIADRRIRQLNGGNDVA